jgi:hypothetical protein
MCFKRGLGNLGLIVPAKWGRGKSLQQFDVVTTNYYTAGLATHGRELVYWTMVVVNVFSLSAGVTVCTSCSSGTYSNSAGTYMPMSVAQWRVVQWS